MWRFLVVVFFDCNTWCAMNSCHNVVRSIGNTILKLCVDWEKLLVRNSQNCGKSKHEFCTMITYHLTKPICEFLAKNKTIIIPQLPHPIDWDWPPLTCTHGFGIMIAHQPHMDRCVWAFVQKQNHNHRNHHFIQRSWFPLPKTEDTDERKGFCCDWGDKRKIERGAVGIRKLYIKGVTLKGTR